MSVVYILLPLALLLGFGFLTAFLHASFVGQYDDLETPAHRILLDDEVLKPIQKKQERKFDVR
jgi:cbb3-type cytochrome oxidase maturation protein